MRPSTKNEESKEKSEVEVTRYFIITSRECFLGNGPRGK